MKTRQKFTIKMLEKLIRKQRVKVPMSLDRRVRKLFKEKEGEL